MSKADDHLDFADVLGATIDQHYGTAERFAAEVGVHGSSVSRWLGGKVPSARLIEQMAPKILDRRGNPWPTSKLITLAYPNLAHPGGVKIVHLAERLHPLARDVNDMLADDSPVPQDKRDNLESLLEALINPYRTYMRKRKSA